MEMFLFIYFLVGVFTLIALTDTWELPQNSTDWMLNILVFLFYPFVLCMMVVFWYDENIRGNISVFDETDVDAVRPESAYVITRSYSHHH